MANWSNPTLTSLYTDFVTEVKNRDVDLALGLDPATTSPTNAPANAIRWNSASFKYQKWDGSTWNDLSTKYIFTAVEVSGSTVPVNGMYLSTTNTLNFSTASTASRLTIDGSGNVNIDSGTFYVDAVNNRVGVGTVSPDELLTVASGTDRVGVSVSGTVSTLLIGNRNPATSCSSISFDRGDGSLRFNNGVTGAITERARIDASGNLGLGVVPSAWSGFKSLDLFGSTGGAIASTNGSISQSSNTYYNGTNWIYKGTGFATRYEQLGGAAGTSSHAWYTAPSWNGTGSDVITFTQAMTLDASGNLGVGSTSISPAYGYSRVIEVAGGFPGIKFAPSGASTFGFQIGAGTGGFQFYDVAAATERARIDSSGYMQGTVNGLGAGRIPAKQYYRLDSAFTGTNGTAAQPIYGVGVTLIGSTVYEFEAIYAFSRSTGSTSHTMSFLFGGTATINNIFYTGVGPGDGILPPLNTYDGGPASFVATSAGASVATAAMTIGTGIFYIVKGTVSINAGGTFIPQYQLSAAPGGAYSTYAGAYFSIWPLAASGAAVNIGSWA